MAMSSLSNCSFSVISWNKAVRSAVGSFRHAVLYSAQSFSMPSSRRDQRRSMSISYFDTTFSWVGVFESLEAARLMVTGFLEIVTDCGQ